MTRKLRPAAELVSDIGSLAFTLRHHSTADIAEAVTFLRTVNPEMFDWLARLLAAQASPPTPDAGETFVHRWRANASYQRAVVPQNEAEAAKRLTIADTFELCANELEYGPDTGASAVSDTGETPT